MNQPPKVVKPHAEVMEPQRTGGYSPIKLSVSGTNPANPTQEETKHGEARAAAASEVTWARVVKTPAKTWCFRFGIAFVGAFPHKI